MLPRALVGAARAVRLLALEPVHPVDLDDGGLTAAHDAYVRAWCGDDLERAAERTAAALEAAAQRYREVESLLVPRALR